MMQKTHINGFFLVGISVRTINNDMQAAKDIEGLWGRFMDENILGQIINRTGDEVYCVYTDYESDHNGYYTAVLGCKVNTLDNIPPGLISVVIAPGTYRRYTAKNWLPNRVGQTWQHIWQSNLKRSYLADFDIYGCGGCAANDTRVEIYVGVEE